jgi:hypothetical protein
MFEYIQQAISPQVLACTYRGEKTDIQRGWPYLAMTACTPVGGQDILQQSHRSAAARIPSKVGGEVEQHN